MREKKTTHMCFQFFSQCFFHALNTITFLLTSTMALPRWILPLLILGTGAITLVPAARQFHDELLRNNLRKQKRSLDETDSPEYYNDLHSFKYHDGNNIRKFDRYYDGDTEEIEFLPSGKISRNNFFFRLREGVRKNKSVYVYKFRIRSLYYCILDFSVVLYIVLNMYCKIGLCDEELSFSE